MNDTVHYAEYAVEKKYEGAYGRKRTLAIVLYVVGPLLVFIGMLTLMGAAAAIWFIPLCPMFLAMIVRTTYNRFFKIEYEYRIAAGELTVSEVYNKRGRKDILTAKISAIETIAPYRDSHKEACDRLTCDRTVEAASSLKSPDLYYAVIPDEEDPAVKTLLYFEVTEKMLRLLHLHNRRTVVTPVRF